MEGGVEGFARPRTGDLNITSGNAPWNTDKISSQVRAAKLRELILQYEKLSPLDELTFYEGEHPSSELRDQLEYCLKHCLTRVGLPPQYWVTMHSDPRQHDLLHLRVTRRNPVTEEKLCSPAWGDVTTVEGRPYYRYDFDSCYSKQAQEHYYSTQEMLQELGFEVEDAHIEHDCLTGFLIEYQA